MPAPNRAFIALCFDLGDTLMIEETEVKDETATTRSAELFPGTVEMLRTLKARGYLLALVADSRPLTPPNVLAQHGVLGLFDTLAISEVVGVSKPHPAIFRAALDTLGIVPADYGRVAMVGNHLERDIAGANRLGLVSIFYHANERRRTRPEGADETPDYTVHSAGELLALIDRIESEPHL